MLGSFSAGTPLTINTTGPIMHLCYCKTLRFQVTVVWLSVLLRNHIMYRSWPGTEFHQGFNSWLILAGLLPSEWRTKYTTLSWVSGLSILIIPCRVLTTLLELWHAPNSPNHNLKKCSAIIIYHDLCVFWNYCESWTWYQILSANTEEF